MIHSRGIAAALLLALLGLPAGAAQAGWPADFPQELQQEEGGIALRFDAPGLSPDGDRLRLAPGSALSGSLTLANLDSRPVPVRLLCLVDWRQVDFVLEGKSGSSHAVTLEPRGGTSLAIEVPAQAQGRRAVTLLVFLYPDHHRDDAGFRADSAFMVDAWRLEVLWGERAQARPPALDAGEPDPETAHGVRHFSLLSEGDEAGPWFRAAAGQRRFTARFNNPSEEAAEYALLAFLDWRQVPLSAAEFSLVRRMRPHSRVSIPGEIPVPPDAGPHEFVVLLVDGPFDPPDFEMEVHSSPRVLVRGDAGESLPK